MIKKLLIFNLLLLSTIVYPMKRTLEGPTHQETNNLNLNNLEGTTQETNNLNLEDFTTTLPKELIQKVLTFAMTGQPNAKSFIDRLGLLRLINRTCRNNINQNDKNIYEDAMQPIVFAAFADRPAQIAFEKVINRKEIYGTLLHGTSHNKAILPGCTTSMDVKKLLYFSSPIGQRFPLLVYNGEKMPIQMGLLADITFTELSRNHAGSYVLNTRMGNAAKQCIDELSAKKHHLTDEQLNTLIEIYGNQDTSALLTSLYRNFFTAINQEEFLHNSLDKQRALPVGLFNDLAQNKGNLLARNTNGQTFIEQTINNTKYADITAELLSFPEVLEDYHKNKPLKPTGLSSAQLLFGE